MKMAKANEADLNMAIELCNALDSLTYQWGESMPQAIEIVEGNEDSETFYRDDREQCVRALGYLLDLAGRASLMRVVFGCAVMLDPRNKCVDARADTIEHHPDVQRYEWLRDRDLGAIGDGGVFAGRTPDNVVLSGDDLDAAIDAAMAMPAN